MTGNRDHEHKLLGCAIVFCTVVSLLGLAATIIIGLARMGEPQSVWIVEKIGLDVIPSAEGRDMSDCK